MSSENKVLNIQVFSDFICPWCFIGKRRLDNALRGGLGAESNINWRPFQLFPGLPYEGIDRQTYLVRRYGDQSSRSGALKRIIEEANSVGIELRYDLVEKIPNTSYAHSLLEWSRVFGLQHPLAEALFSAYFCEGSDVGDPIELISICESVGLESKEAEVHLKSIEGSVDMTKYLDLARNVDVSSVPGYLFDNGYLLPGAQSEETFAHILGRIIEKI